VKGGVKLHRGLQLARDEAAEAGRSVLRAVSLADLLDGEEASCPRCPSALWGPRWSTCCWMSGRSPAAGRISGRADGGRRYATEGNGGKDNRRQQEPRYSLNSPFS
jgi:hypothetical protein